MKGRLLEIGFSLWVRFLYGSIADQAASNNFKNENNTKILFKEKKHNKLSVFTEFFRINTNKSPNKKMEKFYCY